VGVYGRFSTAGAAPFAVAADTKVVSRSTVGAGRLAKLTAYVDTATAGVPVPARAVVYDAANALRGKGQEVVLPTGLSARWVDLPFAPELEGGLLLAAGDYDLGLIAGGAGLRVYQVDPDAPGGRRNADSYADGPSDPFGGPQLCANPSFEVDTAGWDSSASWFLNAGATFGRVDGGTHGAKALRVVGPGSATGQGVRYIQLPVEAGKTYEIAVDVALESGSPGLALSAGASGVGTAQQAFNATAAYQRRTLLYTATGTGNAQVAVSVNAAAASTFLIDNVSITSPGSTSMTGRIRVFAQPFEPYAAPEEVEMYLARLPFPEAQEVFASTGPSGESRLAVCSWHGTALDPERGSFVVAHVDGKFDDWIGERVQVRLRGRGESRAVYGYVYNAADVAPDDISIPRRMFAALAPPGLDRLDVFVERMK
jgi:hypothetical protein